MSTARITIEGIPEGTEITVRRTCICGPGPTKCPGIIETTGEEVFSRDEPPSSLGGAPALRLLPAPAESDDEPHAVPLLEAVG